MPQSNEFLTPFQKQLLERALEKEQNPLYVKRLQIMWMAASGHSQTQICQVLGCAPITARYWIEVARAGNAHLWREHPVGRPRQVDQHFRDRLKVLVQRSPREVGYPFQRWTGQWLSKHLAQETGIEVSDRHIHNLLKEMGLSTRPTSQPTTESQQIQISDLPNTAAPTAPYLVSLFKLPKSS